MGIAGGRGWWSGNRLAKRPGEGRGVGSESLSAELEPRRRRTLVRGGWGEGESPGGQQGGVGDGGRPHRPCWGPGT